MDPIEAAHELAQRIARLRSFGDRDVPNMREAAFASEFIVDLIQAGWRKPPTPGGIDLTDEQIEKWAAEAEAGYDPARLKPRVRAAIPPKPARDADFDSCGVNGYEL